jgi:hypothetical protein
VTVVDVTAVTVVPGEMRLDGTGARVIPTAMPLVFPAVKFRVVGLAAGVPDDGLALIAPNGGCNVKITDPGEPDIPCEIVTLVALTPATVAPLGMKGEPPTAIPTVTPVVSAKCKTSRGSSGVADSPSIVVAGVIVGNVSENAGLDGSPMGDFPMNIATVPAGT